MPICEASVNEERFTLIITLRVIFKSEAGLRSSRTMGKDDDSGFHKELIQSEQAFPSSPNFF